MAAVFLCVCHAAQRAKTFDEALGKASSDGVIVYCYGPDWNMRSTKLLETFWKSSATEAAAGNAVLVAVPFYENSYTPEARDAAHIRGRMQAPPFSVCPTLLFFDQKGRCYASMQGADYLGTDDACTEGVENIKKTLQHLRTQQSILDKARAATGTEKARLLSLAADLPIKHPPNLIQEIKTADPHDKQGYARRHEFDARKLMEELMRAQNGFLDPQTEPDYREIMKECEKIFKDEALKPRDRQAIYNLYIGQSRREHIQANKLKGLIRKVNKLDPETDYGKLSPTLMNLWGKLKYRPTTEERREAREEKKAKEKEKRDKKRHERHIEVN